MPNPLVPTTRHEIIVEALMAPTIGTMSRGEAEKIATAFLGAVPIGSLSENDVERIADERIARTPAPVAPKPSRWPAMAGVVGLLLGFAGGAYSAFVIVPDITALETANADAVTPDVVDLLIDDKLVSISKRLDTIESAGYVTTVPAIPEGTAFAADRLSRIDDDGDGIFGSEDECPNIAGVVIGNNEEGTGCPLSRTTDSDGDGIRDLFDHCVTAEADKAKVEDAGLDEYSWVYASDITAAVGNGCVDTDQDGLADIRDICQGTTANATVDSFGCAGTQIAEVQKTCTGTANIVADKGDGGAELGSGQMDFTGCKAGDKSNVVVHATYDDKDAISDLKLIASN